MSTARRSSDLLTLEEADARTHATLELYDAIRDQWVPYDEWDAVKKDFHVRFGLSADLGQTITPLGSEEVGIDIIDLKEKMDDLSIKLPYVARGIVFHHGLTSDNKYMVLVSIVPLDNTAVNGKTVYTFDLATGSHFEIGAGKKLYASTRLSTWYTVGQPGALYFSKVWAKRSNGSIIQVGTDDVKCEAFSWEIEVAELIEHNDDADTLVVSCMTQQYGNANEYRHSLIMHTRDGVVDLMSPEPHTGEPRNYWHRAANLGNLCPPGVNTIQYPPQ